MSRTTGISVVSVVVIILGLLLFAQKPTGRDIASVPPPTSVHMGGVRARTCGPWEAVISVNSDGNVACGIHGGGGLPAGMIVFIDSGTCPSGYTEVTGYQGFNIIATTAVAGDVGTTGGTSHYTPTGAVAAPAFSGTPSPCVANHTHTEMVGSASTGALLGFKTDTKTGVPLASGYATATNTGGSATCTPAGSVSAPAFTGNAATITPPFVKMIPCRKA